MRRRIQTLHTTIQRPVETQIRTYESQFRQPFSTARGWIHSVKPEDLQGDVDIIDPVDGLPTLPISAHTSPVNRERTPLIVDKPVNGSRWQIFAKSSAYPTGNPERAQRVDEQWLVDHMPSLDAPWQAGHGVGDAEKGNPLTSHAKRRAWYVRLQRAVLRNPLVPLALRLTMWSFSLIALGLGASIFSLSHAKHFTQRPSTFIAIIFDSVALVYLFYITYDEYTSKPLGLRSPQAKMRLILLDLFFIVFNSANLSLAFDTLTDVRGPCKKGLDSASPGPNDMNADKEICSRQSALSGVLLIALVAWLLTFTVSVFRLVERVTGTRE
ncbi:MAG: hypothetical protein M1816_006045 [Peltula sp. TS41687]|nr:MAG: hypothetical protein M1816_006045 [Peltula sp. TS41687]